MALRYALPGGLRYRRGVSGANITQIRYAPRRPLYVGVDRDLSEHLAALAQRIPDVRDQLSHWLAHVPSRCREVEGRPDALLAALDDGARRRVAQELHQDLERGGHDVLLHHHRPPLGPHRYSLSVIFPWPERLGLLPAVSGPILSPGQVAPVCAWPPAGSPAPRGQAVQASL
ncbi:hypothetical protein DFI_18345 (plasmid) [Deinococcus ficus]|uniref:Uncharacterized protein n=1 Tax=Deinococcus ficus TaxID=317577 RepID=A0A221T2R5_9DEIO|nr:hypothetical protein DFI_18345 [Deinococcus ficus]